MDYETHTDFYRPVWGTERFVNPYFTLILRMFLIYSREKRCRWDGRENKFKISLCLEHSFFSSGTAIPKLFFRLTI